MRRRFLFAGAALCATTALAAQPTDEQAALKRAVDRGTMIYAYDQAAWHGTDDFAAKAKNKVASLGGYIVEGPRNAPHLTLYDRDQAQPHVLYTADFKDGRLISGTVVDPATPITAAEKALIDARTTATKALVESGAGFRCSKTPFNPVVLPPASHGAPTAVYFLTPMEDRQHIPMGGHFEIDVAADGTAGPVRAFTKTCLTMAIPADRDVAALTVSHLLDPTPTEIHVFTSLETKKPVFVITGQRLWPVAGDHILPPKAIDAKGDD